MTFTPGITPTTVHFPAKRGFTFRALVRFYQDVGHTTPLDLSPYTPELEMDSYLTLTPGSGLVVNNAAGTIEIVLTAAQTEAAPSSLHEFTLSLEQGADVIPPLDGHFTFSKRIGV